MRKLLGLDKALQRARGPLVDNLAKLSQLDADIAQAQQELQGKEAASNPEKKQRIQEWLNRLRDERVFRLEGTAANCETLRSQTFRIRETIERVLYEDTTLTERLRTLFREQRVTIASILTALGFIVSTIVLAIQNVFAGQSGGVTPAPTPVPLSFGVTAWVKKQLKTLASWLKTLAEKCGRGVARCYWCHCLVALKIAGSGAVWLAEQLWAAIYFRQRW